MTRHPRTPDADASTLPDPLADDLRALRQDVPPSRDLWPGIEARLEARAPSAANAPAAATPMASGRDTTRIPGTLGRRARARRNAAYAIAATLALAVAAGWQWLPLQPAGVPLSPSPEPVADAGILANEADPLLPGNDADAPLLPHRAADAPLLLAADALSREYQAALREVEVGAALRGHTPVATPSQAALAAELERNAIEVRAALARDPEAVHLFHRLRHIHAHRLALSLRQAPSEESTA